MKTETATLNQLHYSFLATLPVYEFMARVWGDWRHASSPTTFRKWRNPPKCVNSGLWHF